MVQLYRGQPVFSKGEWLPAITRLGSRRKVALTFDDGPTVQTTRAVLDLLEFYGAPATFFVTGERAEACPELLAAIVAAGHSVYAHGYRHIRLNDQPPEVLAEEMERTEQILRCFRPTPTPYLVRLPYGAGARDPATHQAIRKWKPAAQLALWSHTLRDHLIAADSSDRKAMERRCEEEVVRLMRRPSLRGGVVLIHEQPYDVDAKLNGQVAPVLLEHLLRHLHFKGLGVGRLVPIEKPSLFSRFVLTAQV